MTDDRQTDNAVQCNAIDSREWC